jgi:hypothetical protein
MRRLIIRSSTGGVIHERHYNGETIKDSEALHLGLCEVDPGDNYTVEFAGPSTQDDKHTWTTALLPEEEN